MNIIIGEDLAQETSVCLSSIMVVLRELFLKYEQPTKLEDAQKVSTGQVIMPIVVFEPRRLRLKNNSIKNTFCHARFSVYSKRPGESKECLRYVLPERCGEREAVLKKIPPSIRDAHFDEDGELSLERLLCTLDGIKADKVTYFYSPCTCEGAITHALAAVHEFHADEDVTCVMTSYFSISVSK